MSLDVEGCIEAYVRFDVSNVCANEHFRSRPITRRRERTSRPFTWECEVGEHGTSLDVGGCMEEHVMSLHLGVRGERARQFS